MGTRGTRTVVGIAMIALVGAMLTAGSVVVDVAPAGAATYTVTSTSLCGGAGTFMEAIDLANANPGTDTIEFTPGLNVEAWTCNALAPPIHGYPLRATQSVDIDGKGATITGGQIYLNAAGQVNDPNQCPSGPAPIKTVSPSVGLLEVGTFGANNSAISVKARDLNFSGMPSLFLVEKNASLSLTDSKADKTLSFNDDCSRSPIQSTDGNVTLTGVLFTDSSAPKSGVNGPSSTTAVVTGFGPGALVMDHVTMSFNFSGRAVIWWGSSAKIVSSQFYESGGFWLDAANSEIVNSAWQTTSQHAVDRIIATKGTVRTDASTFFWSQPKCEGCGAPSLGFATAGTGAFDLHTTAIGSGADYPGNPGAQPLLWGDPLTVFTSDDLTWVQPTGTQNAAAINGILPNALTAAPGLNASFVTSLTTGAISDVTPLLGTLPPPGTLIDAVSKSSCSPPNDTNKLINPIGSTCITTDVFGKPRWDAGNDKRNIGAVQNVDTPHLALTREGDTTVDLQWNRPTEPGSGTITGYSIFYHPTGSGPITRIDVSGADTLTHSVTGLVNGTEYEFVMIAIYTNPAGDGPESNTVHATPYGPVGVPQVSAVPGAIDVRLFWSVPSAGGHPEPLSYFVMYRPVGSVDWFAGPRNLSARITDIPELACGVTYEFGVAAVSTDGTPSLEVGTTTAAPTAPCPEPLPPEPLPPERIFGADAIDTAIAVSDQAFSSPDSAGAVVLARSDFFSDALAGGPLAADKHAPLLITPGAPESATLDVRVQAEIERVLPSGHTVYVLGGPLAVAPGVDTTLTGLGYTVVRVEGPNLYATAVAIAGELGDPSTVFEATGLNFLDALSAGPAAINTGGAILLTNGTTQAPETGAYLAAHPPTTRYAIGGPLAAAGADPGAIAIYGEDGFGTSAAVASTFFTGAALYGIATATSYHDALSGGVFMATGGRLGPMLLVNTNPPLPAPISAYLGTLAQGTPGFVFGGPIAVSDDVVLAIVAIVG